MGFVGTIRGQTEVCASHILLDSEEDADAALERVQGGEDFADVASDVSTGPSGPDGGDLGCSLLGNYVPEFAQGALPGAVNLPLMNDDERHRVGVRYREAGQAAAIALGAELLDPEERARRTARWIEFAHAHPDGALYLGSSESMLNLDAGYRRAGGGRGSYYRPGTGEVSR